MEHSIVHLGERYKWSSVPVHLGKRYVPVSVQCTWVSTMEHSIVHLGEVQCKGASAGHPIGFLLMDLTLTTCPSRALPFSFQRRHHQHQCASISISIGNSISTKSLKSIYKVLIRRQVIMKKKL